MPPSYRGEYTFHDKPLSFFCSLIFRRKRSKQSCSLTVDACFLCFLSWRKILNFTSRILITKERRTIPIGILGVLVSGCTFIHRCIGDAKFLANGHCPQRPNGTKGRPLHVGQLALCEAHTLPAFSIPLQVDQGFRLHWCRGRIPTTFREAESPVRSNDAKMYVSGARNGGFSFARRLCLIRVRGGGAEQKPARTNMRFQIKQLF